MKDAYFKRMKKKILKMLKKMLLYSLSQKQKHLKLSKRIHVINFE